MAYKLELIGTIPLRYLKAGGVLEKIRVLLSDEENTDLQVFVEDEKIIFCDDTTAPTRETRMRLMK